MNEQKLLRRKQRAIGENNTQQQAQICRSLADFYQDNQQYEKALENYKDEAKAYKSLGMRLETGRAHRMIGEMYMLLEDFDEALSYELKYLKVATEENNKTEEQRAYATIGRVYLLQAQSNTASAETMKLLLKRAEKNFLESLLVCKKLTENQSKIEILDMQARLYLNLGVTNECKGTYDEAINYMEKAMTICRHNDFWELLHQCYSTTGLMYTNKLGDTTKALRFLNLAINIAERLSTNRTVRLCQTLQSKAEVQIKMGDFQGAKQVLYKAYKMKSTDISDRESIESNLRIVAALCYAENTLMTMNTDDYVKRKKLYEKMGDGSCKLKNYDAAIGYYLKMLHEAQSNNENGKDLIPIYVSLYQTYKDTKQYALALEFMWKEYELCKDVPSEAFSTLYGIADTTQLAGKDFWVIDEVYERAREEAKKMLNKTKEKIVIESQIALRTKHGMETLATIMKDEAKAAGLDVTYIVNDSGQDSDDESEENNTPDIGDDICLEDITDDSASEEESKRKSPAAATAQARTLRKRGVIAVKRNEKGETQLHRACISGNVAVVRRLLDQEHTINVRDNAGWLPLHEAANHGFKEIVELLLEKGAAINDRGGTNCDGVTPLHDACGNGMLEVVELLLDRGANATLRTDFGNTPLQSLDDWRKDRILDFQEQSFYESVRKRLLQKLEKAGIATAVLSPEKNIETGRNGNTPSKSFSRGLSITPRKRIISTSSNSSDDRRSDNGGVGFDSENIETVESILHQAFPSTQNGESVEEIDFSLNSDYNLDYRQVMKDLRTNNMQNRLSNGSGNIQPVTKITKRPGILGPDEIEADEWLDDDVGPSKKRRKPNNAIPGGSGRLSLSGGKKATAPTPIISDSGISSTFENCVISDDENSVDAFTVLMNSTETSGRRKRNSGSSSNRSSRDSFSRQQSSLLESGFSRHRVESPETIQPSVSSTVHSPFKNTAPASTSYSVKVKVEENLLNVPIFRNNADDLTIEWLAEETAKRYYNLKGVKPILRLTTQDGAIYENSDPLHLIFNENSVIASTVLDWITPPLSRRYLEACGQFKCDGDPFIQSRLELIPSTQLLSITNQILSTKLCRPLFKALNFQSNLNTVDLSNCFIEDDGVKHLSQAFPTLPQLATLNLSGNLITAVGIKHMTSLLESKPKCLSELKELYLNFNPLQNQSLPALSSLCCNLDELNTLHLISTELTNLRELDFKLGSLVDLDLSYNSFVHDGLVKAIEKLNACKLARLNLSFCATSIADENDEIFNNSDKPLVEALAKLLNAGTCTNLEEVHLSGCSLTDVDCWRLLQPISRSKLLRHVALKDNPQLTKVTLKVLLETLSVKYLHLEGSNMILSGFTETEAELLSVPNCCENVILSLSSLTMKSDEICSLKRMWNVASRRRGKIFNQGLKVLLTLKSDNIERAWGHSLL